MRLHLVLHTFFFFLLFFKVACMMDIPKESFRLRTPQDGDEDDEMIMVTAPQRDMNQMAPHQAGSLLYSVFSGHKRLSPINISTFETECQQLVLCKTIRMRREIRDCYIHRMLE
jgi:hypothetical protein